MKKILENVISIMLLPISCFVVLASIVLGIVGIFDVHDVEYYCDGLVGVDRS